MPYLQPRNTPLALTSIVRSHTSSPVATASSSFDIMMPALLNSTLSLPKRFSALATMLSQSRALATSARTAMALGMAAAVSRAACSLTSTATTEAPSLENSNAASRPMPLPAPVIRATLSFSLTGASYSFEIPAVFPVGDRLVVGGRFGAIEVRVVLDDFGAEGARGEFALGEGLGGLGERVGHARQAARRVDVADEALRRLDLAGNAVQTRRQR